MPGASAKRPVVILLPGHGEEAAVVLGRASFGGYASRDWATLAEREHLLLIAPEGVKGSDGKVAWNDCRGDATTNATTDERRLHRRADRQGRGGFQGRSASHLRVGYSNGGGMAYRLGIELAPRLAAIGVQSALMPARSRCAAPARPVSVFILHGTADPIAPYAGGDVGNWLTRGRGSGLSAEATVAAWRNVNGGHMHASKDEELPWLLKTILGPMNHDVDTAGEAWRFFRTKSR